LRNAKDDLPLKLSYKYYRETINKTGFVILSGVERCHGSREAQVQLATLSLITEIVPVLNWALRHEEE
jgi:hypothetical protein